MYVRIPVPRISPGLLTNLLGVLGLVAIVCAIGGLTHSPYWAMLAAGVFAVGLVALAQHQEVAAASAPAGANVTAMEPARRSRISVTAEAQLAAERARTEATG